MVSRLDHIDLRVENFEETIAMLELMGLVILRRIPAPRASVEMSLPGEGQVVLELRPAEKGKSGVHHIAFRTDGDELAVLKNAEFHFLTENAVIQATGRTVSTFEDRNGLLWQLTD